MAVICAWIDCIALIITAFVFFSDEEPIGWAFLVSAPLVFVASWPMYGFGQLIEDVAAIRSRTELAPQASAAATPGNPAANAAQVATHKYTSDDEDMKKLHTFISDCRRYQSFSSIQLLWDSLSFNQPTYLQAFSDAIFSKVSVERVYGGTTPADIANFCDQMKKMASRMEQ